MKRTFNIKTALAAFSLLFTTTGPLPAAEQTISATAATATAQQIADHFSAIRLMTGEFVQFGPKGEMTQGTFYLERPGKIRFAYKDSPITVIADGTSIVIHNKKLDTWSLYRLSQTPLKLLLDDRINLSNGRILEFRQEPQAATILFEDKSKARIRMIFDPENYTLRQWTIIDRKNQETTVQLTSVRTSGFRFDENMFKINYQRIATQR